MSIKLVMEMESDNSVAGSNDEVVAAQTATEVEAAASELGETGAEAEKYADGIDTAAGAAEELGEVEAKLEEGVESGEGVSAETAEMAEIAVEAICAKVGISARRERIMPAMESFGSSNSRLAATKLALEGIKETAQRIWESIKKAAVHVWNVIKSFIAGLFKSRTMLEKHLKNLKERVNNASGTPKSKTFSTAAKAFSIDGKANPSTVETILTEAADLDEMAKAMSAAVEELVTRAREKKDVKAELKELFDYIKKSGLSRNIGDNRVAVGYLVGGRSFVVTDGKDDAAGTFAVEVTEKNPAKEIDAPTKEQIGKVIDQALKVIELLKAFDKISKSLEKTNKLTIDYADKMIRLRGEAEDKKSEANDAAKALRSATTMMAKIGVAMPNMMFGAAKAAADYANAGINNLDKEEKK